MQVIITAVGPDNRGLADPIVHQVTQQGANISEIQMYDHDAEAVFAMLNRIEIPERELPRLREAMDGIARQSRGGRVGPGGCPPEPPGRSGRAQLAHPAPQDTGFAA